MGYEIASTPATVISLCVIDGTTLENDLVGKNTRLLVVVRRAETNITHPNVVSVPTERVPPILFHGILCTAQEESKSDGTTFYKGETARNTPKSGHHPVIYAVASILSKKLGVAGSLELGRLKFSAVVRAMTTGKSYYPDLPEPDREEYIAMANIIVVLTEGTGEFPLATPSYSHILWIPVQHFLSMVQKNNPLEIGLDPIEYCVHGHCVSGTCSILTRQLNLVSLAQAMPNSK